MKENNPLNSIKIFFSLLSEYLEFYQEYTSFSISEEFFIVSVRRKGLCN